MSRNEGLLMTFLAQVSDWVRDVQAVHEAVFRESAKRVAEDMLVPRAVGGNMPVVTGFLRASLLASTSAMPIMSQRGNPNGSYSFNAAPVTLAIAQAELGDTIYVGFTAIYARKVNYSGYLFVEKAAQKWQSIVKTVEAELIQRAGLGP